jgi:signal transduction histidine kinase
MDPVILHGDGIVVAHPEEEDRVSAQATLGESARPPAGGASLDDLVVAAAWLRPSVAAAVLVLAFLTLATSLVEHALTPMPASHLLLLPAVLALYVLVWALDLAGAHLPRVGLALLVVVPHVALSLMGHAGVHTLYLLLVVAWVTYTGDRRASVITLGLALAAITIAAGIAVQQASLSLSAWISWGAGLILVWLLAQALVNRQRLLVELAQAQAGLAEQLRVNAELHAQAQRAVVLDERQRLARELHDSATQSLYSARLYTEAALRMLSNGDSVTATEHLREVKQLAADALAEMRLLIHELRPPVLEERGLAEALRVRLESVEERAGLAMHFQCEPEAPERLPAALEQELYGLAQEALNNALKHAHPSRVSVALHQDPARVRLEISDDGVGFEMNGHSGAGASGLGLRSMQERAERAGGRIEIVSRAGEGTRVRVEVPR